MVGREGNLVTAIHVLITGIHTPTAEEGTAFFSLRLPPFFLFARILAFRRSLPDNKGR